MVSAWLTYFTTRFRMMNTQKYPHLFSPITLAGTLFRNRIFASPTGTGYMDAQHHPIQETNAYYERKAMGGAASVCIGDAVISDEGRFNNFHIALGDPGILPSLSRLSESITRHGAVASIEILHGGSHARFAATQGFQIYGPMETMTQDGHLVKAMSDEKIEEVIEQHANAALLAKRAGFGMVTIHGGHGWLITEFLSPVTNRRTDKWGGSHENRCRFAIEICKAVRRAVGPRFPIEMRISGSECHPKGYDLDVGIAIAKSLDGHLDLIHVSAGSHEIPEVFMVTHPDMLLPDGANVKYAAEIKKHVKTAVATVGALAHPDLMEEIIASGQADVVQVARGLISDPDLPLKARSGREDEINKCMRCLWCFSRHITKSQYACAINPVIGREIENKWEIQPAAKKKILVAGGGIGGMQAAITAAERGHKVVLCEKTDKLGGVLCCEHDVPFKKSLAEYLERQANTVRKLGVDIRLNTEVTPTLAEQISPDVIIASLGARPLVPPVAGIDGSNVLSAEEAYENPEKVGEKVVIIGGGLAASELAIYLSGLGREVEIIEMEPALNDGDNLLHGRAIVYELARRNVAVNLSVKAVEVTDAGVIGEDLDGNRRLYSGDTVVYATGQAPLRAEADALRFSAPEFYQIGDCLEPKNIPAATRHAYYIVRNIGRF